MSGKRSRTRPRRLALAAALLATATAAESTAAQTCERTIRAEVVALDQAIMYNRLGARDPVAMIYALRADVEAMPGEGGEPGTLGPGTVRLRAGKRPRPLTLRMNVGDCLQINLTNWLSPTARNNQPATRNVSAHVAGMQLVTGIGDDGSNVGNNGSSLVAPGGVRLYTYYAEREGSFLLYSTGQTTGGDGDGGTLSRGLFGAVNVEPRGAEWYRSQLTAAELTLATRKDAGGNPIRTPAGQPVLNYDALYPTGHALAGRPILKMLNGTQIVHSDLTAIITGPNKGNFAAGTYPAVRVEPNRLRPFREFTIVFHDEIGIIQAFNNVFEDPRLEHTLHSGRDAFAINYGTGGIGAEVLGNRFGVGPMWDCNECKYEEFFLSSWAVGDPAMVVDVPADHDGNGDGKPDPGRKATRVFYPEDPSNVYHSYINDHVKFRNLHAGPKEHHIFHLHAHQWLHTPDSDNSTYLDSQAIGPGAGFTYEITYNGSGNRNKTVGDAIFHCHFYPHFAMGMWGLWRNHDVFEAGTQLGADGRPAAGSRALPDGEILAGTPIPALVPIPTYALAPMPADTMPGYPFYIPGVAGHRPPKPPLDTEFDGGLPRHVVRDGTATFPVVNRLDFHKENVTLVANALPEGGTALELKAMAFHARRLHNTWKVDGAGTVTADNFVTNGRPPVAGAPFADPCVDDNGNPANQNPRTYKAASFQIDARYNKAGWHFPQHRMFALWDDVAATRAGTRAPEPLFFRAQSNDCITYHLVNLVPHEYQLDDFQVRTPTDVVGQHIHLVKFDVTSSDGAANGFNYEDGSFAPGETRERVRAIRRQNACTGLDAGDARDGTFTCPVARAHPFFGAGPANDWVGAQETKQRWWADNTLNLQNVDRTLRTVFTHDHFGPSTHQQAGLYAGLVVEPDSSTWRDPETGVTFGTRFDGGPTSWRADILTARTDSAHREFNVQVADFALAYQEGSNHAVRTFTDPAFGVSTPGIADPAKAVNPAGKFEDNIADLLQPPFRKGHCPSPDPSVAVTLPPPCPELLSADDPGTMLVNYRNEPVALRVRNPTTNGQAAGQQGDLAFAFSSSVTRADTRLNAFGPYGARPGVGTGDPFTPLMRAYEGDRVQIRILVGAHEEGHNFSVNGVQWLFEPSFNNSGHRNSQMMGISEHFEFVLPPLPRNNIGPDVDYLYRSGSATDDLWNGIWGILRATQRGVGTAGLLKLPNNAAGSNINPTNAARFNGVCPTTAPQRALDVTAVLARNALPHTGNRLVYNSRIDANGRGPIHDPNAIMYVRTGDLNADGTLKTTVPIEPLILRAVAGECLNVTLRNRLPAAPPDSNGWNTLPMIIDQFNANDVRPSGNVGLHAQLFSYDVTRSDGMNVGKNPVQTAAPGGTATYQWYAGKLFPRADSLVAVPVAFGALNLMPADPIEHASKGAIGAMSVWRRNVRFFEDAGSRASASIVDDNTGRVFREHVLLYQTDLNLRLGNTVIVNLAGAEDPEDSGQKGANYRTEPLWFRMGFAPGTPLTTTRGFDFTNSLANSQVGGYPVTPVFRSEAGQQTLFRVLLPGGHARNSVFNLHGHVWDELPYIDNSTDVGFNPLSEWKGMLSGHGPSNHYDIQLRNGAGGRWRIQGDYLWRDQTSFHFDGGIWGLFRVVPVGTLPAVF